MSDLFKLAHAYQQIELDEDSKELATINTHKGLYHYHRLPFGISAAPSIFHGSPSTDYTTAPQGLEQLHIRVEANVVCKDLRRMRGRK
jgi:hypothetical protein